MDQYLVEQIDHQEYLGRAKLCKLHENFDSYVQSDFVTFIVTADQIRQAAAFSFDLWWGNS